MSSLFMFPHQYFHQNLMFTVNCPLKTSNIEIEDLIIDELSKGLNKVRRLRRREQRAQKKAVALDEKINTLEHEIETRLDQVKPTCHLLPVERDTDFIRSFKDFPTIVDNLRAIETLGDARKTRDNMSVVISDPMHSTSAIKLTHHLFVVCSIHSSYSA